MRMNEPTKAIRALQHWKQAGEEMESIIELRQGDLLETLEKNLPEVDFLLLDSKCFISCDVRLCLLL